MKATKQSKSPDTKRLDWMVENKVRAVRAGGMWNVWNNSRVDVYDTSLRRAIDKAMRAK